MWARPSSISRRRLLGPMHQGSPSKCWAGRTQSEGSDARPEPLRPRPDTRGSPQPAPATQRTPVWQRHGLLWGQRRRHGRKPDWWRQAWDAARPRVGHPEPPGPVDAGWGWGRKRGGVTPLTWAAAGWVWCGGPRPAGGYPEPLLPDSRPARGCWPDNRSGPAWARDVWGPPRAYQAALVGRAEGRRPLPGVPDPGGGRREHEWGVAVRPGSEWSPSPGAGRDRVSDRGQYLRAPRNRSISWDAGRHPWGLGGWPVIPARHPIP